MINPEGEYMSNIVEYGISFLIALIIAFVSTPIARRIAFKVNAIDIPKDARRMHKKPIPRLGGLAIFSGFLISAIYSIFITTGGVVSDVNDGLRQVLGLIAGIVIIESYAFFDDITPLHSGKKFIFQFIAATATVLISDTRITTVTNPFTDMGYSLIPDIISFPLTIIWIVGITNAVNFLDGLDGLVAGVASISSLSLFFVSILGQTGDPLSSLLMAGIAGAALGFLPFNFNPAKIFMGETGAAFLGFALAFVSMQGTLKTYTTISIAVPLLVLGLPIFDIAFAVFRRLSNGKSPATADRGHIHHRLIDMGLSHKQSVVVIYMASAALGLCAIVLADSGVVSALFLLVAIAIFVIGGAKYMTGSSSGKE